MTADPVELCVVIPVYRAENCLDALYARLQTALSALTPRWQIVFVEDRSPDDSWKAVERIAKADPRIVALRLSRNYGQHAAITAGLARSSGRWVVVMDCDLENPPEELKQLYAAALEGNDIVFARRKRRRHSFFRRCAAKAYFALLRAVTGTPFDDEYGTFSILSRKVVTAFLRFKDQDRHYLFILHWMGFKTGVVDTVQGERAAGNSSYSLSKLIRHALAGVFFQTTAILRWIVYGGLAISFIGMVLAGYYVYRYLKYGVNQEGWTSLMVLVLVLSGIIMASTGIGSLYVGRTFEQVKDRPLYIVDREIVDGKEI